MAKGKTKQQLTAENEELRSRLLELEDTLEAIRSGAVDAIVAAGPEGDRVYTLEGADHAYLKMVESMSEGAVTLMTDGTILYANRQFGQMTGRAPSEIAGGRFHEFVSARDRSVAGDILQVPGACFKTEIHLLRGEGEEFPVQVSASPIALDGAEALTLVVTDLSDRKKLEEIAASEQLSRSILEQAREGIAVCIDGCIVRANRALYGICGNIPLMQPFDQVFSFQLPESHAFSIAMPESGKTVSDREVRYRRPDGRVYDLILNAGPLVGNNNRVIGSLVSLVDITDRKRAEEAVRESERKYRSLFENIEEMVAVYGVERDAGGRIVKRRLLEANPAFLRAAGASSVDEIRGKRSSEIFGKAWSEQHLPAVQRAMDTGAVQVQEACRPESGRHYITSVVRLDSNTYLGTARDITGRKAAEEALAAKHEELRIIFDTVPAYIFYKDRENRFLRVNEAFTGLMGMPREELEGKSLFDVTPREQAEAFWKDDLEVIASGRPKTNIVEPVQTGRGQRWVRTDKIPHFDDRGNITGIIGFAVDITERKAAEEELRRSERRFRQVAESLPQLVWACAADGLCDYLSPQWVRYTGRSESEQLGYGWLEQLHPDDRERVIEQWQVTAAGGGNFDVEFRIRRHDGAYRWFRTLAVPLRDEAGRVVKWFGSNTDIDDIKRAEEALHESERQLRHALSLLDTVTRGTNVIIATQDASLRYTYFNRAYAEEVKRLTGRDLQIGSSMVELLADLPEQQAIAVKEWRRPLGGETVSKTIEFGDPGRHRRVFQSLQTPLYDDSGAVVGAGEVALDITEQVQVQEALQRSEARFRLLSETAGRLLAAEDPQALIDSLCREVMGHLDCQAFFNFMVDEAAGRLRLNACAGIPEEETRKLEWLDYGVAVCGCVARDGVRIIAEDIFHTPDARTELVKSYGIQAYCCHPMKIQERLIGTLSFGTKTRERFTPDEVELMRTVADQVAVALERVLAQRELRRSKDDLEVKVRERTAELNYMMGELERSRDDLRRLAAELVMAEEMERKRIAVTLHDEVAQTLAAAKMRLDLMRGAEVPAESGRVIDEARELLAQSIRETRSLMTDISSPVLYDMGLTSAVQAVADQTSAAHGIPVSYLFRGDLGDLRTELAVMIYHVVKELLQNVVKHSRARSATIRIAREDNIIRTVVTDDGRGFEAAGIGAPGHDDEGGFGLFSIRERVKSFDGDIQIESAPGKGTAVTVTLPAPGREKEGPGPQEGERQGGRKKRKP